MSVPNKSVLTSEIRTEAERLGFFKVGVTAARPLPSEERLERWLADGMQGAMGYMERQAERRKDPRRVMENARSLVVAATNYNSGESLRDDPPRGRISRYAWVQVRRSISATLEPSQTLRTSLSAMRRWMASEPFISP